jgi:hypothetical protein
VLAQRGDVLGLVRRQDDRAVLADAADEVAEAQPLLGVEADGRLVEHDELRLPQQRGGEPSRRFMPPLSARTLRSATSARSTSSSTRRTSSWRARRSVSSLRTAT